MGAERTAILEGGSMDNNRDRNKNEDLSNKNLGNESSRRPDDESFGSSSGRTGSSDIEKTGNRSGRDTMESERVRDRSSEGEH
jgi:hypothetical protein